MWFERTRIRAEPCKARATVETSKCFDFLAFLASFTHGFDGKRENSARWRLYFGGAMRMTVLILVAACAVVGAQPASELEWSATRKLRRSDFKGSMAMQSGIAARSAVVIQASWICQGDRLDANVRAMFDMNQSWWRGGTRDDNLLLQHEQTHFDIAELVARRLRAHFATLTDACERYGGTVPLGSVVDDYQRELDEQQARYDRETSFGIDARAQWAWTSKTQEALKPKRDSAR
jgi:hypothetical protein